MSRSIEFQPAIVRKAIERAAMRDGFVAFVENLTTRPVQMRLGVMAVGQGESPDLEDTMETVAARYESKQAMALRMINNPSLITDLSTGLKSMLIDPFA